MHEQNVLGEVLRMEDKISEVCAWETVVLLPRSSRHKLEDTESQSASNQRKEKPPVTYLFTEQTASMYVEYNVVKVNRHGTRQERILGIDREKIYNLLPRLQLEGSLDGEMEFGDESVGESPSPSRLLVSQGSRGNNSKQTKKRARQIKHVHECSVSLDDLSVASLVYKDGSTYHFDFSSEDKCAEAVARINFLIDLNTKANL